MSVSIGNVTDTSASLGGPSGSQVNVPGWAYSSGTVDYNTSIWVNWGGTQYAHTIRGAVPSC